MGQLPEPLPAVGSSWGLC